MKSHGATDRPLVVRLHNLHATDPALTGRKAAGLATLRAAGFDVPDGFVLTTAATAAIIDAGVGSLIPQTIADAIRAALAGTGEAPLTVRSSAVAEDLPDASLAGQFETILDVRGALVTVDGTAGLVTIETEYSSAGAFGSTPTRITREES